MPRTRLRGPSGTSTVSLGEDATIADLQQAIVEHTKIDSFELKLGYPPQPLELNGLDPNMKLNDLGLKLNGEQLIVNPAASNTQSQDTMGSVNSKPSILVPTSSHIDNPPTLPARLSKPTNSSPHYSTSAEETLPEIYLPARAAKLILRVMPDDNSCLFRALSSALLGTEVDGATELRSIVASEIQSDPAKYSAVVLAQEPAEYCKWIQSADSWGGAIEVEILSRYFGTEVCSIDVQTGRVDRYLEGVDRRCIIVYSGVHYDVLALTPIDTGWDAEPALDTKVFDASDDAVLGAAAELCDMLKDRHYYTDTSGFSVKCNTCGWLGTGEKDALVHARKTGHYDFGETT